MVVEGLAALVEHLHDGADANGGEKRDDQHRNRAPQQGLGRQQPPIRRFGDRLREALDGIWDVQTHSPAKPARAIDGLRSDFPLPP